MSLQAQRRYAAQAAIASVLAEAANLHEAVPRLLQVISEETGWALAGLWQVDRQSGVLRCEGVWRRDDLEVESFEHFCRTQTFSMDEGLPGRVWKSGRAEWIENVREEPTLPRMKIAALHGLYGAFAFPILLRGELTGVMEFFATERREIDQELIDDMLTAGRQIGQVMERWRAEQALRESEERYRIIGQTASDAIFTIDRNDVILYANPAVKSVFGWPPEDLTGQALTTIIPERFRSQHREGLQRYMSTHQRHIPWAGVELPGLRKDGSEVPLELSFGVYERGGEFFFTGFARDITERKRAEDEKRALLEREQRARKEAEAANANLRRVQAVTDVALTHLSPNELFGELMKRLCTTMSCDSSAILIIDDSNQLVVRAVYGREGAIDQEAAITDGIAGRVASTMKPAVVDSLDRPGNPLEEEMRSIVAVPLLVRTRLTGVLHVASRTARQFSDEDLHLLQLVAERIALATENARLFEAEREARIEAQRANLAKDQFLATLSHELRTPMTSILGWARMLGLGDVDEETLRTAIDSIQRSAKAQSQLIEDVLDVSRIVTGKLKVEAQSVKFQVLLRAAIEMVMPAIETKRIRLDVSIDNSVPATFADPTRIQQVFWNLLGNAAKFTPDEGYIKVSLRREGEEIELEVTDNGPGIAPEFLPHMFERFRQADSNTTRAHGGLGLGLAIVKHIVDLHHGTIYARSHGPGKGASFIVRIPMRQSATPSTHMRAVSREVQAETLEFPRLDGLKFLVVDDDNEARRLIQTVLERCGADAITRSSVEEALGAIESEDFDALVSDVAMPEKDGYLLIREVRLIERERGSYLPALALTASAGMGARERSMSAGFDDYRRKPIEPIELAHVVARISRKARRRKEESRSA